MCAFLLTEAPDSPHHLALCIEGEIYFACAETDIYAPMDKWTQGFLVGFQIYPSVAGICLLIATAVGFVAGGLPARNATRISVVDGLRRVV